jgi:hypothetical protein
MRRTELVAKARRVVGLSPHSETSSAPVVDTHTWVGSKRKSQDMDTEGEVDRTAEAVAETTTGLAAAAETVTVLETVIDTAISHGDLSRLHSLSSFILRSLRTDLITARERSHVNNMYSVSHQINQLQSEVSRKLIGYRSKS